MYLQLIYEEHKEDYLPAAFVLWDVFTVYIFTVCVLFLKVRLFCFFFISQAAGRYAPACPPPHSFPPARERALLAQAQKYRAEEGCDVSKYTSERSGHRYETVRFPLTTCMYLGVFPNCCKVEEGQCLCTWWKYSGSSKCEWFHATSNWRWMSLTVPGSSLTNLKSSGLKTTKALSQARRMEILESYSNRRKGSASSFTACHPDKKVG